MNNFIWLTKINIIGFLSSFHNKKRKSSLPLLLVFAAIMALTLEFNMYYTAKQSIPYLSPENILPFLIQTGAMLSGAGIMLVNIYKIPGYLFASRDYDMLVSMPILPRTVLLSKLSAIYMSSTILTYIFTCPFILAAGIELKWPFLMFAVAFLCLLFISIIPILIAMIIGFLIAKTSSYFKKNNVAMILCSIIMVLFLAGFSIFLTTNAVDPQNISKVSPLISSVSYINPSIYLYTLMLSERNLLYFLALAVTSIGLGYICITILSKTYSKLNLVFIEKTKSKSKKIKTIKKTDGIWIQIRKEKELYFSSFLYVINSGMGMILYLFMNVLIVADIVDISGVLDLGIPAFVIVLISGAIFIGLTCSTCCSVSFEGKRIWQLKSLPIDIKHILNSKIIVNLLITSPFILLCTVMLGVSLKIPLLEIIFIIIILVMFSLYISILGLIVNLYKPKMDWKNESEAIKQSASALISIALAFVSMFVFISIITLCTLLNMTTCILICVGLLMVVDSILYKKVQSWGIERFYSI